MLLLPMEQKVGRKPLAISLWRVMLKTKGTLKYMDALKEKKPQACHI